MTNGEKTTGIIYRAYNKISGKSYIGQTIRPLQIRKNRHYSDSKKHNFKFSNALRYYSVDSWEWTILAEVKVEELDEYEKFFIDDLETLNPEKGYNCYYPRNRGDGSKSKPTTVYELYHKDFGIISGTYLELAKIEKQLSGVYRLVSGNRRHIKGWVLAKHKDSYEFLTSPNCSSEPVTLSHDVLGTYTLYRSDFVKKFGLTRGGISALTLRQQQTHLGWRLVDAINTKD